MIPFRSLRTPLLALACAASFVLPALAVSPAERTEIETIVREYLLKNPEVLRDAMIELQRRTDAAEAKARAEAVQTNRKLLFDSPRGVVIGNRNADVAVVEFFDYNCGYCKRALSDMMTLIKDDPKLKFVLKEFPVLGESSVEAAKVSIAVRMQDKDGAKYADFHRILLSGRGEANRARALAAAKEASVDMALLEKDMKSKEIDETLRESAVLANALGLSGTPSYVIADEIVPGAVGAEALKQRIDAVRKCGQATC